MKDQATVYRARLSRRQLLFALCGIAVLPLWPSASAKSSNQRAFQFGYLTGSYLISGQPDDFRLLQESQLFLQDAIKTLSREKLDFVIFGGDNVIGPGKDDVNWQLFIDIAQSLSCPWQFVLGENDISGSIPVDPMRTYGRDWKGKGIETDKTYWSQDPLEGVHLIGLDTSEPNSTAGYLSGQQLAWLEKDLQTNANNFTIVVSHHPLLPPPPFDGGPPWDKYIVPQGPSAREIIGQQGSACLALSGHVHISKIQREKNVWYISSPSLNVYPCAFRIFRVTADSVSVETYQISFPALVKKARRQIENWSLPYKYSPKVQAFVDLMEGAKTDKFACLPLDPSKGLEPLRPKKGGEAEPPQQTAKHRGFF